MPRFAGPCPKGRAVCAENSDFLREFGPAVTLGSRMLASRMVRCRRGTQGRPQLAKLMQAILPGDIVVVTKLDRVARSARDLLNIIHELKERSCGFISLGDAWCDTTNEMGRFMLTVMSGIAELERDLIRKRCQAGIERAKEKGVKFGRPRALGIGERKKIAERYGQGETMAELARDYDVGEATIHRAIHGR